MAIPIKILIIEDVEYDAELMVHALRREGFEPEWQRVETEEELLECMRSNPELILADYTLPRLDAPRALEIMAEKGFDVPVIIVTGSIGEVKAVNCMKLGAADYLLKDRLVRLGPAVSQVLETRANKRKKELAEKALRDSEARYRSLVENIPIEVFLKDKESKYISVNKAYAQSLGNRPEQIFGKTDFDFFPKASAARYQQLDQRVLETGERIEYEDEDELAGRKRFLHVVKAPLRDNADKVVGVVGAVIDITDRRKLEGQFRQAQKMEAVGRLAGGVAHDFNNMLGVILGFNELAMIKLPADDPVQMYLGEVQSAAQRSADITRQLLAFARKQIIAPKILDLNDTIASMLKMFRRLIGEDIDLLWKPANDLWPVKMDPAQIDQILANLMVNARDAIAGVGKITIETGYAEFDEDYCEAHPGFVPGRYVLLAVSDDGCGMDKPTLAKLFEPFFTTKEVGKGTGLGLATIYGIVKQNNGFINVYSEPGQGTTFRIYLPRQEPQETSPERLREPAAVPSGTETVLLVEDEKVAAQIRQIAA